MRAADWNARYAERDLVWGVEPNRFVAAECEHLEPGTAVDLACGEGRNAIWLAARGWRVTAVDFADVAVERGRRLATERGLEVDWVVADVVHWTPPAAVDLVVIAYLQLPPEERAAVWQQAAASVAPGGTLLVVGHDARNLAEGAGGPQDPNVLYGPGDVTAHIPGLVVERAESVERPTADGRTAIDCLVRARRASESR